MVCMKCKKFYRPKKNGVVVEEMMPQGEDIEGTPRWVSYKAWMADLYVCPGCNHEVVGGFSLSGPFAEHYQEGYASRVEYAVQHTGHALIQVPDCGPTHFGWRPDKNIEFLRALRGQLAHALELVTPLSDRIDSAQASIDKLLEKYDEPILDPEMLVFVCPKCGDEHLLPPPALVQHRCQRGSCTYAALQVKASAQINDLSA